MVLQAIKYERGHLEILDQLLLPDTSHYLDIKTCDDAWHAIKKMQVRGAPAIAIVGCLSLAVEIHDRSFETLSELKDFVTERLNFLVTSRPTAVNMADSAARFIAYMKNIVTEGTDNTEDAKISIIEEIELMLEQDIATNKRIGKFGGEDILARSGDKPVRILTHCNTGSLATAGHGTALGVIRYLHGKGKLAEAFCTETRPYNQGARLTAYELVYEQMHATLICDSMAAILLHEKDISAVVVGADRVVANGDTANKIGTYQLAIVAKHHNVPFYVACPLTTYDGSKKSGHEIEIEERPADEMVTVKGIQVAAEGIKCWNPAFDVTPAELITGGIVTEYGVFPPKELTEHIAKYVNDSL